MRSLSEPELEGIRGAEIAIVFEDSMLAFNPVLRVCDQINEVVRAHEECKAVAATTEDLLRLVGLPDSRRVCRAYPRESSGGERQRLAIAQALTAGPALVVADEPFTSVDTTHVIELCALFRNLTQQAGVSFLVISHSPDVLASITDYDRNECGEDRREKNRAGTVQRCLSQCRLILSFTFAI